MGAAHMQEYYRGKTEERGRNVLEDEEKKSWAESFLEQLNDPLIFILFVAAAISLLLREYGDMAIILAVVLLNATVGVIQEGKAKKSLEVLKQMTSPHALLLEGDEVRQIPAADLIPGDLVVLEAGCQVPADLVLTEAVNLKIEESALTGESVPVNKDTAQNRMAYMSTNVTYGRGVGRVSAIGMDTEIGRDAEGGEGRADTVAEAVGGPRQNFGHGVRILMCAPFWHGNPAKTGCGRDADYGDLSCGGGGAGGTSRHCDDGAGTFRLADGEGKCHCKAPAERGDIGMCQRCVLG